MKLELALRLFGYGLDVNFGPTEDGSYIEDDAGSTELAVGFAPPPAPDNC